MLQLDKINYKWAFIFLLVWTLFQFILGAHFAVVTWDNK